MGLTTMRIGKTLKQEVEERYIGTHMSENKGELNYDNNCKP